MHGETDLKTILKTLTPIHNKGEYVFCTVAGTYEINRADILGSFSEKEGLTVIVEKQIADRLGLPYTFISSWITLNVHTSLEAVGLTAIISKALADNGISCNIVAANYHDHIFVPVKDAANTMKVLQQLIVDCEHKSINH
jgi:hypothetical protein